MNATSSGSDSITLWIEQVQQGERHSVRMLLERFLPRLVSLAASRLRGQPQLTGYAEDIALSVFHALCLGAERGRFPDLSNRQAVWQLLAAMTIRKTIDLQRKLHRESQANAGELSGQFSTDPLPDQAAEMNDQIKQMLEHLGDAELKQIVLWKTAGFSNEEIAVKLGCTVRTVERKLHRVRQLWRDMTTWLR
jgi:RNA polymerase sigma factor (sigma-70 family)